MGVLVTPNCSHPTASVTILLLPLSILDFPTTIMGLCSARPKHKLMQGCHCNVTETLATPS
ncbi:hypothetical protein ASPFODRAFT_285046 [Aspergillus luchuensis CBS 106.47]|uniref:Uncharacterized protein n=1 Tax=Aspergillus luchuensis (strain CBS 106.47) TaxID=1137211 RepID=A0A1M3TAE3_ASPLC|nr:hypothetical protein ASPFODRAFT_285046 [Aspergillus luchuensis CBS 106.47]